MIVGPKIVRRCPPRHAAGSWAWPFAQPSRGSLMLAFGFMGLWVACDSTEDTPETASHTQHITNGDLDQEDVDRAMVGLVSAISGQLMCSGTLISDRVVLTAAHCVPIADDCTSNEPDPLVVAVGPDATNPETYVGILDARRHPLFNCDTLANDIGLLYLERPLEIVPRVAIVYPLDNNGGD